MTEVYRKITVDLSRQSNSRVIFARQRDVGARNLIISLTDDGKPYEIEPGNTAAIVYLRPDQVSGAMDATVLEDGTVLFEIPQVMLNCVGEVACYVMMIDTQGNYIASSDFYLDVKQTYYTGESLADDPEYSLLVSLFNQVGEYKYEEELRKTAEVNRVRAENARYLAELRRDEKVKEVQGVSGKVTLEAAAWSKDCTQELIILGIGEHDFAVFYPESIEDRYRLTHYGVFICPDLQENRVSCVAKGRPSSDISLRYFIVRGRESE